MLFNNGVFSHTGTNTEDGGYWTFCSSGRNSGMCCWEYCWITTNMGTNNSTPISKPLPRGSNLNFFNSTDSIQITFSVMMMWVTCVMMFSASHDIRYSPIVP